MTTSQTTGDLDPFNEEDFITCITIVVRTIRRKGRWSNWEEEECISEGYIYALRIRELWNPEAGPFMKYLFSTLPFRISDAMRTGMGHKRNQRKNRATNARFISKEFQVTSNEEYDAIVNLPAKEEKLHDHDWEDNFDWFALTPKEIECVNMRARGIPQKEIGYSLGVCESRVCQILKQVKNKWSHHDPENNNE